MITKLRVCYESHHHTRVPHLIEYFHLFLASPIGNTLSTRKETYRNHAQNGGARQRVTWRISGMSRKPVTACAVRAAPGAIRRARGGTARVARGHACAPRRGDVPLIHARRATLLADRCARERGSGCRAAPFLLRRAAVESVVGLVLA